MRRGRCRRKAGEANAGAERRAARDLPPAHRRVHRIGLVEKRERNAVPATIRALLELFARSLDIVQETITRFKLAAQPPDLLITIPRNACAFYEFHRADELIELGRKRTREALARWHRPTRRVMPPS